MEGKMKVRICKCGTIVLSLIFLLFMGSTIQAQEKKVIKESVSDKAQKEQIIGLKADNKQTVTDGKTAQKSVAQQNKDKKKKKKEEDSSKVKEVKASNPDMSKAKGARPPYIVRPTGAGMPKGAGNPGGAIRPGRR
jgi:hypothetical protein